MCANAGQGDKEGVGEFNMAKRGGVFCAKALATLMWWVIAHVRSLVANGVAGLVGAGS